MKLLIFLILLSACSNPQTHKVVAILGPVSNGEVRIELEDGSRKVFEGPIAVGDKVICNQYYCYLN